MDYVSWGGEENFPDDNIGIIFIDLICLFYSFEVINKASLLNVEHKYLPFLYLFYEIKTEVVSR